MENDILEITDVVRNLADIAFEQGKRIESLAEQVQELKKEQNEKKERTKRRRDPFHSAGSFQRFMDRSIPLLDPKYVIDISASEDPYSLSWDAKDVPPHVRSKEAGRDHGGALSIEDTVYAPDEEDPGEEGEAQERDGPFRG